MKVREALTDLALDVMAVLLVILGLPVLAVLLIIAIVFFIPVTLYGLAVGIVEVLLNTFNPRGRRA